jgi:hypothetical protein
MSILYSWFKWVLGERTPSELALGRITINLLLTDNLWAILWVSNGSRHISDTVFCGQGK